MVVAHFWIRRNPPPLPIWRDDALGSYSDMSTFTLLAKYLWLYNALAHCLLIPTIALDEVPLVPADDSGPDVEALLQRLNNIRNHVQSLNRPGLSGREVEEVPVLDFPNNDGDEVVVPPPTEVIVLDDEESVVLDFPNNDEDSEDVDDDEVVVPPPTVRLPSAPAPSIPFSGELGSVYVDGRRRSARLLNKKAVGSVAVNGLRRSGRNINR